MKRRNALIVLLALCTLGIAVAVTAQDEGCVKGNCHEGIGNAKWVHGPVGVGACTVCHNPVEGKDHQFVFAMEKEELCFACHDETRDMMLEPHRHTPVAAGECTGCHDPHQSEYRFTLKNETSKLCFNCHERVKFESNHVHGPIKEGDCNACHNPHASAFEKQLFAEPTEICFKCHSERTDIQEFRHSHPPVEEDCMTCHKPHVSERAALLRQDPPDLCYKCHSGIADFANATHPHDPVQNGGCLECHNVHGSAYPSLMPAPQTTVCFRCHDDFEEYIAAQEFRHGPIQQDDCIACHNPHGSENHRILRKYFPEEFYVAYAEENYAMCFECHNGQIALEEKTETLTDFRNGKQNLHHLHVNKLEKGRSCKACHQPHASSQSKHIRLSVPFGKMKWDLPVKFSKTEKGGRCEVGCHNPKEYKR